MVPQHPLRAAVSRSYHGVVTSRFVSYAQNFEDVILWRALHDVTPGFYIDIGANSPTIDSVTKAFYERGWRGINVEPPLHFFWCQCVPRRRGRIVRPHVDAVGHG